MNLYLKVRRYANHRNLPLVNVWLIHRLVSKEGKNAVGAEACLLHGEMDLKTAEEFLALMKSKGLKVVRETSPIELDGQTHTGLLKGLQKPFLNGRKPSNRPEPRRKR